jgi:hypothetical protein
MTSIQFMTSILFDIHCNITRGYGTGSSKNNEMLLDASQRYLTYIAEFLILNKRH